MNTESYLARLEHEYPAEYLVLLLVAEEALELNPQAVSDDLFGVLFERIRSDYKQHKPANSSPRSHVARELLAHLEEQHKHFSDEEKGNPYYRGIYLQCLPAIVELRAKNTSLQDMESKGEIATAISAVVGVALLKSSGQHVEKATEEAVRLFTLLFKVLGELMMKSEPTAEEEW